MTSLFNIDKVFIESSSIIDKFNSSNKETFLYSTLDILREFNNSIKSNASKELYKNISESSTKEEQNDDFCKYFYTYRDALSNANKRFIELVGRFTINIDNLLDANKDLMNINASDVNFDELEMDAYKYNETNLKSLHVPNVDLKSIFKTEFDEIALLMQELGPIASDADKIKIIVSTYNKFNLKLINDWKSNFCDVLFSASGESYDNDKQFATNVISLFRDEEPETININLATLYEAKSALSEAKEMLDNTVSICTNICADIDYIANDIGSTIFRNKDCKFVVDSTTAGVQNKSYNLNTYGINQLDIFMKAKTNQITQAFDMVSIALSIKMDMIFEYLKQNTDIIFYCINPMSDTEEEEPAENPEVDDNIDDNEDSDSDNDDLDMDDSEDSSDDLSNDDDDDFDLDLDSEPINEEEPEIEEDDTLKELYDLFQNSKNSNIKSLMENVNPSLITVEENMEYLFNYTAYRLQMVQEQDELNAYIASLSNTPLFEADGDVGNAITNSIQKIIPMLKKNWMQFQNNILNNKTPIINALRKRWDSISKAKIPDGYKFTKYNTDKLVPDIPNFNLSGMRDNLDSDKQFIDSVPTLKPYTPDDNANYIDKFKNSCTTGVDQEPINSNTISEVYQFCIDGFDKNRQKIGQCINKIENAAKSSKVKIDTSVTINNASAIDELIQSYFNEVQGPDDNNTSGSGNNSEKTNTNQQQNQNQQNQQNDNDNQNNNDQKKDKPSNDLTKLKTYVNVCSKFIGASMTMNSKAFAEYSKVLNLVDSKWGSGSGIFNKNDNQQK